MRIKILHRAGDIQGLDSNERHLALLFSPTQMEICAMIAACPDLETVMAPPVIYSLIYEEAKTMLMMHGVYLIQGQVMAICDSDGRYTLDRIKLEEIRSMRRAGLSSKLIVDMAQERLSLPPDLTQYLLMAR
ncbi:MAG: DUF1699 family protein [Methanotrichaceae archaeon]|nr:DUF1699 family protein [Methanotrichaceae archaeon]